MIFCETRIPADDKQVGRRLCSYTIDRSERDKVSLSKSSAWNYKQARASVTQEGRISCRICQRLLTEDNFASLLPVVQTQRRRMYNPDRLLSISFTIQLVTAPEPFDHFA